MSRIAAIGSWIELAGYALAGVDILDARDSEAVLRAWDGLGDDTAVVILTADARSSLPDPLLPPERLWAVLPQ